MILILGGTTEGRIAVSVLEEAGQPFYYSTKGSEQQVAMHHGLRLQGGLDEEAMKRFCREHDIRLLIDAAHPFATQLHASVERTANDLSLPVIRLERTYLLHHPEDGITWCSDYADAVRQLSALDKDTLILALTGVQSIARLRGLWQGHPNVHFRILHRDSSLQIARQADFPSDHLHYYEEDEDGTHLLEALHPQAVLLKESGASGGFDQKVEAARRLGIRIYAIRRPALPQSWTTVTGPHGLRRQVERLLPGFFALRSGVTTGTCATAAAVAAIRALFTDDRPAEVPVTLPDGETISLPVHSQENDNAKFTTRASVIKDAGDDPDITNGLEIQAVVSYQPEKEGDADGYTIRIEGGDGVGRVTLPGLGLAIGQAAINATPRQMLTSNVSQALRQCHAPAGRYTVTISVPEGEEIATKTFNPRLGIVGGISILGTSGIVRPFSTTAFIDSIRKSLLVARATGSPRIIINSGAKSERFIRRRYPDVPPQAFVHYGNFIGETLKLMAEMDVPRITLGLMMGKAVKLAEGHLDTHSKKVTMNKEFIARMACQAGCPDPVQEAIRHMTLARELWQLIPPQLLEAFCRTVIEACRRHCAPLLPAHTELTILLMDEDGGIHPTL